MELKGCLCCEDSTLIFEDTPGKDEGSSYKCCCEGVVHIKTATLYVAISALLLSAFSTVCLVLGVYTVNFWLDVILIVVNTIATLILLWGLYVDSAPLLIPFIVVEIAQCAGFFMLAVYVFWFTLTIEQHRLRKFDQTIMVISILIGIVIAGSAVWAAAKCYHYLRSKQSFESVTSTTSTYASSSDLPPDPDYPWSSSGYPYPKATSLPPVQYAPRPTVPSRTTVPTRPYRPIVVQPGPRNSSVKPRDSPDLSLTMTRSLFDYRTPPFATVSSARPYGSTRVINTNREYFPNSYTEPYQSPYHKKPKVPPLSIRSLSTEAEPSWNCGPQLRNAAGREREYSNPKFPALDSPQLNGRPPVPLDIASYRDCPSPYCNVPASSLSQSLYTYSPDSYPNDNDRPLHHSFLEYP